MLRLLALGALGCAVVFPAALSAQSGYDFNGLMGSDTHPYTLLDQQDGWSEETFRAANRCGVTATLSHDMTQCLRFQEVGPGYGCDASRINDSNWSFGSFFGNENSAFFEADVQVGFWGGSFGLAYDANANGRVRGSEAGERGVFFTIGTQANVQLRLHAADGTTTTAQLGPLGIAGGNWVRVRVGMDLSAASGSGLGYVSVKNITAGDTRFTDVADLQGAPLNLTPGSMDARDPSLWNAMWLHFEGATYALDNILIGSGLARGDVYGSPCANSSAELRGLDRPVVGTTATAETVNLSANANAGVLILGLAPILPGVDLTNLGAPGCHIFVVYTASAAWAPQGGTGQHALTIPNMTNLVGASLYLQSAVSDFSANQLGVVPSNGLRWLIGAH